MKVKNINGITKKTPNDKSWLEHWRNFSGQTSAICRAKGCFRTDLIGAQVQKDIDYDNEWYIVPLCSLHNNLTGPIELTAGTNLVSVNKRSCEKAKILTKSGSWHNISELKKHE